MRCRLFIPTALCMLASILASADSIIIDGILYPNATVYETKDRYYVRLVGVAPISVEKSAIEPGEVVFGDETIAKPFNIDTPAPTPELVPKKIVPPPSIEKELTPKNTRQIRQAPVGPLFAGAARVVLSADPNKSPREANALLLRNDDLLIAFCVIDAPLVSEADLTATAEALTRLGSAVTPNALIISATGLTTPDGENSPWPKIIAQAIHEAEKKLAPAAVRIAEAEAPDYHKVRAGASVTPDSTLSVLHVEDLEGAPLAFLVNYAVYPYPHQGIVGRGVPGHLAEALRTNTVAGLAVLFTNGAAGDVIPKTPTGGDASRAEESIGQALARAATTALEVADRQSEAALTHIISEVALPTTLFDMGHPATATLQEIHLGDATFLTFPAALAAQIGLLMRVKAFEQDADYLFLLTHTGDFLGYHPTIEEYFAVTPETRTNRYGPLMLKWYADHHLKADPETSSEPAWRNAPALGRYAASFNNGIARGAASREELHHTWATTRPSLERLCRVFFVESNALSQEANAMLVDLDNDAAPSAFSHFAALFMREQYALFSGEERAILMGVAEGAKLPFDAVLVLQVLSDPNAMSPKAASLTRELALKGIDFFNLPQES